MGDGRGVVIGPIEYFTDPDRLLLYVRVRGHLTAQHILDYLGVLASDPTYDHRMSTLVDLTRVTVYDVDASQMKVVARESADFDARGPATMTVLVSGEDFVFGMLRMFQMLSEGMNKEVRVARSLKAGCALLGIDEAVSLPD